MGRNRRSIRLPGNDYGNPGAYFVTICAFNREQLFGTIDDGHISLNSFGDVLANVWARVINRGGQAEPYDFVVMPNHVHGIVWLAETTVGARRPFSRNAMSAQRSIASAERHREPVDASPLQHPESARPVGYAAGSAAARVAAFKSQSARAINRMRNTPGAPVWQRNYYERIVRNEDELVRIRQYILDNPAKWPDDPNNPALAR